MMELSRKTEELVNALQQFSGNKIKNETDLSFLIEISALPGQKEVFKDIQFTAKYLNGLGKVLHTNISTSAATNAKENGKPVTSEDAKLKIMKEFETHIRKLSELLKTFVAKTEEKERTDFEDKYLGMNRGSLQNLTTLIYDLSWLKSYNNRKKTQ